MPAGRPRPTHGRTHPFCRASTKHLVLSSPTIPLPPPPPGRAEQYDVATAPRLHRTSLLPRFPVLAAQCKVPTCACAIRMLSGMNPLPNKLGLMRKPPARRMSRRKCCSCQTRGRRLDARYRLVLAQSVRRFPTLSRCFLATMRASRFECPKASRFARVLSGMNPLPQQTLIDEITPRAQNVAP